MVDDTSDVRATQQAVLATLAPPDPASPGRDRGDVAALVSIRAVLPASIGAAAGAVTGWLTAAGYGHAPPVSFSIAVAVCTLITTAIAILPPALIAARRDPVRVMRTP